MNVLNNYEVNIKRTIYFDKYQTLTVSVILMAASELPCILFPLESTKEYAFTEIHSFKWSIDHLPLE